MKVFETTFIVNPQADDATIDRQVKSVADIITGNGGKILHENRMGTRKLAYDIQRLSQGYYSQFVFEAPNVALTALERHYKLSEEFIRHLTIRVEGDLEQIKEQRANRQAAGDDRPDRGGRFGRGDRDRDRDRDRDDDDRGDDRGHRPRRSFAPRGDGPSRPYREADESKRPAAPAEAEEPKRPTAPTAPAKTEAVDTTGSTERSGGGDDEEL